MQKQPLDREQAARDRQRRVLDAINRAQAGMLDADPRSAFGSLLTDILSLTESEYGFLAEVVARPGEPPFLLNHAISNIAWNADTRAFYAEHAPRGMVFPNLQTLYAMPYVTGEPVLTDDPGNHPGRAGLPEGHPPLRSYLGLPLRRADEIVGVLGLANRRGGYSDLDFPLLQPLFATVAHLIEVRRNDAARREAIEALRASERNLRSAQAVARLGSWEIDLASGEVNWSEQTYGIFGLSPAMKVDYELFLERVHPDDREKVAAAWQQAMEGASYDIEHRIVRGEQILWVRERAEVERDADGAAVRGIGTVQDITADKKLQETLRLQGAALQAAANAIVITDVGGTIRWVNPAFSELTGFSREEAVGRAPGALVRSGVQDAAFYRQLWETILAGRVWKGEVVNRRKNDSLYCEEMTITPLAEGGSPHHFIAVKQDITARKKAENALREREAWNKILFADSQIPLVVMDPETGCFIDCNNAALRIYGLGDRQELLGRNPLDVSAHFQADGSESYAVAQWHAEEALARGSHQFEWRHRRPDGEIWDALVHLMAFDHGERRLLQFGLQDITERRRIERIAAARMRLSEFAQNNSLDEFLQRTLDEVEALTASGIGFFHFLDDDQRTLHLQMWSSNTVSSMCTSEGKGLHYDIDRAGVWADAVRERRPVIHNDYGQIPHRRGLPAGHAPVSRELVVPVFRGERIVAVIGVGNKAEDYDARDVELVTRLADECWDIAARKRAEEELRRLSHRNKLLLLSAGDGILGIDMEGRTTFVNPAALRMLGFSEEELLGEDPHLLFHHHRPDGSAYPAASCPVSLTLRDGRSRRTEDWFIRRDGSGFPVQLTVNAVQEKGTRTGTVVIFQDLTQRKEAEEALQAARSRLSTIIEHFQGGVRVEDEQGCAILVNQAFFDLFNLRNECRETAEGCLGSAEELKSFFVAPDRFAARVRTILEGRKPVDGEELTMVDGRTVQRDYVPVFTTERFVGHLWVWRDVSDRKDRERELTRLATTDTLTGLPNRRHFMERLEYELARFKRLGKPVSLLMVDLDHFKKVNDTWGHAAGDDVLRQFAQLARGTLRAIDMIGRLGGEEFGIILPGSDREGALHFAERLRTAVMEAPMRSQNVEIRITTSIGITLFAPDDKRTDTILGRVDNALYAAKQEGRNRCVVVPAQESV